jgi:hypothetical protein
VPRSVVDKSVDSEEIDVRNCQLVTTNGDKIVVVWPNATMDYHQALVHAAWLVALVDDDERFHKILAAVRDVRKR